MSTPAQSWDTKQAAPSAYVEFQPRFIFQSELTTFGLPWTGDQPNIMNLIDAASSLIDEYCGRTDGDGHGSLVYTTYSERMLLPEGRNLFRTMQKPLSVVDADTTAELTASGANYFTGVMPNTVTSQYTGDTTALLSASGRYGYSRRASQQVYPDLNYGANVLQIASFFGGPPAWTYIDITMCDYDPRTGEIWVPAGLYLSQYTEVVITYNSGYDPRHLPQAIKHACAALVKNFLSAGGGTTGLRSLSAGGMSVAFTQDWIDPAIERWLRPFRTVIAY